jgi:hypothetical protein
MTLMESMRLSDRTQRQLEAAKVNPNWSLGSRAAPMAIVGSEWQAGVSPGNEQLRVTLNDEPMPLAIAASTKGGWVITRISNHMNNRGPDGTLLAAGTVTLRGKVQIVPIRHNESL